MCLLILIVLILMLNEKVYLLFFSASPLLKDGTDVFLFVERRRVERRRAYHLNYINFDAL